MLNSCSLKLTSSVLGLGKYNYKEEVENWSRERLTVKGYQVHADNRFESKSRGKVMKVLLDGITPGFCSFYAVSVL